eukprot:TRINITY_DN9735_c0_g5_i1.p1 TRINITY_DN9735_c0_g5~~TRINITY_DN9735_c0_g5_i1.p1  ORF type:complete len:955 (+),score=353.65 TRINITY_DN9735_c0_g5_i1:49-2865(+)
MTQKHSARQSPLIRRSSRGAEARRQGRHVQQSFEVLPPEGGPEGSLSPSAASAASSVGSSRRAPSYATAYTRKPTTRRVNLSHTTPARELTGELLDDRPSTAKVRRSLDEAAQFGKEVAILSDLEPGDGGDDAPAAQGPSPPRGSFNDASSVVSGASAATPSFERGLGSRGFLGIETVEMIRCELKKPIEVDPKTNTVSLTRELVESIRDAGVLSSLAATTGFSKAFTGGSFEEYLPTNVFLTELSEDGEPKEATIEEDMIVYSVCHTPAATPHAPVSEWDDGEVSEFNATAAPSEASSVQATPRRQYPLNASIASMGASIASTSTGKKQSYMRATGASAARRRDPRQEKKAQVDARLDEVAQHATAQARHAAARPPACASTRGTNPINALNADGTVDEESAPAERGRAAPKLGVGDLTSRRMLTDEEEARVQRIEDDARFDVAEKEGQAPLPAGEVPVCPGEGYALDEADTAALEALTAKLQVLRPGEDIAALFAPEVDMQAARATARPRREAGAGAPDTAPEKERDARLRERAKESALALRPPEDYLTVMKQERALRSKLRDVNDRLVELYEKTADDERAASSLRAVDSAAAPLSPTCVADLLAAACREQGVPLPAPLLPSPSPPEGGREAVRAPVRTAGGGDFDGDTHPDLHPLFSGCEAAAEEEPEDPTFLFKKVTRSKSSGTRGPVAAPPAAAVELDVVVEDADADAEGGGGVDYDEFQAFLSKHHIRHIDGLPAAPAADAADTAPLEAAAEAVEAGDIDTSDLDAFISKHGIRHVEVPRPALPVADETPTAQTARPVADEEPAPPPAPLPVPDAAGPAPVAAVPAVAEAAAKGEKDVLAEDAVEVSGVIDDIDEEEDDGDILFFNREAAEGQPPRVAPGTVETALGTGRGEGRSMFLSGDWDALLMQDAAGTLYRPDSRVGTPLMHQSMRGK